MEQTPKNLSEYIPTPEEILLVFKELIVDAEYQVIRQLRDENGLYLYDIKIQTEDGYTEYSYRRGRSEVGELEGLRIDLAYFDLEGNVVGGHSVGHYINGRWRLTP